MSVDYRLYQTEESVGKADFKSKLDLAIEIIVQAFESGLPFDCVMTDSWYFSEKLITAVESMKKDWICASKSNRTWK